MKKLLYAGLIFGVMASGCKKKGETTSPMNLPTPGHTEEVKKEEAPPAVKQMVANFSRVYFDFDSATLSSSSKTALAENAGILQDNPDIKVEVQGHADERGTTDYNLALGQKRANSVQSYLSGQGIAKSRITTVSYGEERPLQDGASETAWSKNRRAEFRITWGGEGGVQGTVN